MESGSNAPFNPFKAFKLFKSFDRLRLVEIG
jgi:hypothetical protein